MKTRNLPESRSPVRDSSRRLPKVELVIACEGKNTEPRYFEACVSGYGAGLVRLRVLPETGVPITVVRAAIEERNALIEMYRESRDSFDCCFRVWAVFDKDDHEVEEALALANTNQIDVAFSNPCFELWPILHLEDYGRQDGRHLVQRRLRELMPSYDHSQRAEVDFSKLVDTFPVAYRRAEKLLQSRELEDCALGCPSTTVGALVLKIIQNGRHPFAREFLK